MIWDCAAARNCCPGAPQRCDACSFPDGTNCNSLTTVWSAPSQRVPGAAASGAAQHRLRGAHDSMPFQNRRERRTHSACLDQAAPQGAAPVDSPPLDEVVVVAAAVAPVPAPAPLLWTAIQPQAASGRCEIHNQHCAWYGWPWSSTLLAYTCYLVELQPLDGGCCSRCDPCVQPPSQWIVYHLV